MATTMIEEGISFDQQFLRNCLVKFQNFTKFLEIQCDIRF